MNPQGEDTHQNHRRATRDLVDGHNGWSHDEQPDGEPNTPKQKPRLRVDTTTDVDRRPEIRITADTHTVTEFMVEALRVDPFLYHRNNSLVHVVASEEVRKDDVILIARGTPRIRPVPLSMLIDRVSKFAICLSFDGRKNSWKHKAPPRDRVNAVLERGEWQGIRELVGVIEAPSMRPDGSLIQDPGYDAATRFLYMPSERFERIPHDPSPTDAKAAYDILADVFRDFPYVDDSHKSAAIALVLTLVARPAILGPVPAWLYDASVRRSGKTKQVDAASIIATGRPAGRSVFPYNPEELSKVIAGHAQDGTSLIFFDNVPESMLFGGSVLDAWITAEGRTNYRKLGETGDREVEWHSVVVASGNGIECGADLAPRCLAPRLESPLENPELRTDFTHDPLLSWVKENRPRLVVAALTLLRAYVHAGKPPVNVPRWGSFEAWTGVIASALVWVDAADPIGARKGSGAADDPKLAAERVLVSEWKGVCHDAGKDALTAAQFIMAIYAPRKPGPDGAPIRDLVPVREAIEYLTTTKPGQAPDSKKLGRILRGLRNRNVSDRKFVVDGETGGTARWRTDPTGTRREVP